MGQRPKKPPIPRAAGESTRRTISDLLSERTLSAREISEVAGIPEKEVYGHLYHIRRTLHASEEVLVVTPAVCRRCAFDFVKRERLAPPGKCPICRHESIEAPLFTIHRR